MRSILLAVGVALAVPACAVLAPTSNPTPVVRGPFGLKTNGPIVATLLQFRPRAAGTTPVGRLRFELTTAYSSMFEDGTDGSSTVFFDGELLRTALRFRTGVSSSADVEIEVPFAYASSGFLDSFIENWHAALGFPNGGRGERDKNQYSMHVDKDGQRAFDLEPNELELGDVPIVFTQSLLREAADGVSLDLRAGVELPSGSQASGFGNGGIDWGGGVIAEKSINRFTLGGGAYFVDAATADSFARADIEIQEQGYLHTGLEFRWNESVSLVTGLRASTPATRDVTIEEVDGYVVDLDLGFVFSEPGRPSRFSFGLSEDLVSESGPDFTAFCAWACGF